MPLHATSLETTMHNESESRGETSSTARGTASTMVRLAANLSFLFKERPFLERFQAAAAAGFRAVPHAPLPTTTAARTDAPP